MEQAFDIIKLFAKHLQSICSILCINNYWQQFYNSSYSNSLLPQATSGRPSAMVWVGGLPEGYNRAEVEQAFDNFGAIANIVVSKSRSVGSSYTPGYAFIEFKKK